MYYHLAHTTTFTYDRLVFLDPHTLRLRPRSNGLQRLCNFALNIQPQPAGISQIVDLDGNASAKVWFESATKQLEITTTAQIETSQTNPFHYQLESWANKLPIDYPSSLQLQLQPYLKSYTPVPDPVAIELAQDLSRKVDGKTTAFLGKLNQHIYKICQKVDRQDDKPWFPGISWKAKRGSSQDLAILFVEVCRSIGLAARFVTGYRESHSANENPEVSAWAEIYLPGAGWRGYDPSQGLVVADNYVSLSASAIPIYTTPIQGSFTPAEFTATGNPKSQVGVSIVSEIHLRAEKGVSD
ncbi:MAG: transglutaminase family protein [Cyanobacteriota bacterium]|nr:transglutaminase family protein [Cyanobacteriota bacterium]